MLNIKDARYKIGHNNIINGINIHFEPGRFHVIVGPNGSGKSTFLKIFSGEIKPQQGMIQYDNVPLIQLNKIALAQRRAVMSQQPELHFPLAVSEVVMMGRYPHFTYKPTKHDESVCEAAMEKLEVTQFANRNYLTLSGGEKQRVQFARVLAQIWDPPASGCRYLFLDEPISSLDIHYQHQFLQIAKQLTREKIVLIAVLHDLNLSIQYADNIIFMKEGRIKANGKPADVITSDLIHYVFNIPVSIIENPVGKKPLVVYDNREA